MLSSLLTGFNSLVAAGTLFVLVCAVLSFSEPIRRAYLTPKVISGILAVASIGLIGAPVIYQYFFGFPACTLCWYQRIFMWPMGFMILGTLLWRDQAGRRYVLSAIKWLAPAGLVFSIWHYISQLGLATTEAACGAAGQSVSCDGIDVIVWGFMTIPLMAGIGFISLFILLHTLTKMSNNGITK
jgi:disulfide bond formation protein DsbB